MHVNGESIPGPAPKTVDELLAARGWTRPGVVVELNGRIIPREAWARTRLTDSDRLEVVTFVGGR